MPDIAAAKIEGLVEQLGAPGQNASQFIGTPPRLLDGARTSIWR
jgi:hypothetical protein